MGAFNLRCEERMSWGYRGHIGRGCVSSTFVVVALIMANAVDVKNGDALFLHIASQKEVTTLKNRSLSTDLAQAQVPPKAKERGRPKHPRVSVEAMAAV